MARSPKLGLTVIYDVTNKDAVKPLVKQVANDFEVASSYVTLNGAEVDNVSLIGGNVTTSGKSATVTMANNVTLSGAEVDNITVIGGGLVTSKGKNATLQIASNPQKSNANFSVTPTAVTLNAYEPATISTAHDGDGIVTYYADNRFITAEQLNANEFRVAAKYVGSGNVGFWLGETESLYGAARNVNVVVKESNMPVLMHFDDESAPFKNEGYATFTTTATSSDYAIDSGGKFDNLLKTKGTSTVTLTFTNLVLGGRDFTVDCWNKQACGNFVFTFDGINPNYVTFGIFSRDNQYLSYTSETENKNTNKYITSEWTHLAAVYEHAKQWLKFYIGGELVGTHQITLERKNIQTLQLQSMYIDELRILDDTAAWTSDFVPPTMPY